MLRLIGRIFFELFFEIILHGTGHVLIRFVKPKSEPSDTACAIVGIAFWIAVYAGGYATYRAAAA